MTATAPTAPTLRARLDAAFDPPMHFTDGMVAAASSLAAQLRRDDDRPSEDEWLTELAGDAYMAAEEAAQAAIVDTFAAHLAGAPASVAFRAARLPVNG